MADLMMKRNENSITKFTKNQVEIFLCSKANSDVSKIKLSEFELNHYLSISNPSRRIEFLSVRFLKNYFDSSLEIGYLNNGKPILNGSQKHISISHSKNFVGIAVAPHPIGFDIEECHERIFKVRDRFLNDAEKDLFDQNSISELTIAWCAKESLFKLNDNDRLDFKSDLILREWNKSSIISSIMLQDSEWKEVELFVGIIENLILCFNFE
jgi:4'-phosphopantetheinyl transferase EntD